MYIFIVLIVANRLITCIHTCTCTSTCVDVLTSSPFSFLMTCFTVSTLVASKALQATSGFTSVRTLSTHRLWLMLNVKLTTPFTPSNVSSTNFLDSCNVHRAQVHNNNGKYQACTHVHNIHSLYILSQIAKEIISNRASVLLE